MRSVLTAFAAIAACFAIHDQAEAQYVYIAGYAPTPAYVAPVPTVALRPVPVVAYRSVVVAPAPVVVAPAAPVVTTRYRPFLGGTVTRVRYRPAPVYVVPAY